MKESTKSNESTKGDNDSLLPVLKVYSTKFEQPYPIFYLPKMAPTYLLIKLRKYPFIWLLLDPF